MKRLLIFGLLGPPVGMLAGLLGILPILNWSLGEPTTLDYHQVVLLPLAYTVGTVPAIVVGIFDGMLAKRGIGWRVLWTTLFAFGVSFAPLLTSMLAGFIHGPFILLFGIVGAVPGAICSCLAGGRQKRTA